MHKTVYNSRCVEVISRLADICRAKGHLCDNLDILTLTTSQQFDRIIMNPPFEKGQDMAHVMHCFNNLLAPGGISSLSSVKRRSSVMARSSMTSVPSFPTIKPKSPSSLNPRSKAHKASVRRESTRASSYSKRTPHGSRLLQEIR
jgi:hypothetical protein